jgi:hypothetical protein
VRQTQLNTWPRITGTVDPPTVFISEVTTAGPSKFFLVSLLFTNWSLQRFCLEGVKVTVSRDFLLQVQASVSTILVENLSVSRFQEKEKRGEMITKNDNIK